MALTDCPECGHQVSDTAQSCPNCGHPLSDAQTPSTTKAAPTSTALVFSIVGAVAIIIGSLLPWISVQTIFGTISASGTEGDGIFTLIAGAIVGAVAGVALSKKNASRTTGILVILLGIASGLIAFNVFSNLAGTAELADEGVFTTIGGGLWLVILGAAAVIGSGVSVLSAAGTTQTQPKSTMAGVGVGVAVVAVMLIALAVYANQSAGDSVAETFEEISSGLDN